ncbi:hypothetical protein Droror1_Dr00007565 [Drosera rotundifolia]
MYSLCHLSQWSPVSFSLSVCLALSSEPVIHAVLLSLLNSLTLFLSFLSLSVFSFFSSGGGFSAASAVSGDDYRDARSVLIRSGMCWFRCGVGVLIDSVLRVV